MILRIEIAVLRIEIPDELLAYMVPVGRCTQDEHTTAETGACEARALGTCVQSDLHQRVNRGRANAKLVSQATMRGEEQFAEDSNILFVHRRYGFLNPCRLARHMQKCHSLWLCESVHALHGRSSVERSAIRRQA